MAVEMVRGTFTFSPAETSQLRIEEYIEQVENGAFVFEFVYRNGKKEKWGVPLKYHTQPVKRPGLGNPRLHPVRSRSEEFQGIGQQRCRAWIVFAQGRVWAK